jgi:hypothetical protein
MHPTSDGHPPAYYWSQLSQDDKAEFLRLRTAFHQSQQNGSKDRRSVTFPRELVLVLNYIEHDQDNIETRAILAGVCFAGPIVCINTRQLKNVLSRCKSSINGSFQQLGYVALRTKAKARMCVLAALPSLAVHQNILRQWTARYTSEDAQCCFVSSFRFVQLPPILAEDLFDEKAKMPGDLPMSQPQYMPLPPKPAPPLQPTLLPFDLPSTDIFDADQTKDQLWRRSSTSMTDFRMFDVDERESVIFPPHKPPMKRSESLRVNPVKEWNLFNDDDNDDTQLF